MLKIKSSPTAKVMRRGDKIIIITEDGGKQSFVAPGMEESACIKEMKKMPDFKTIRRKATRIAKSRWESYWWEKEYMSHSGTYEGHQCLNLRDYITVRMLLEQ